MLYVLLCHVTDSKQPVRKAGPLFERHVQRSDAAVRIAQPPRQAIVF